VYYYIDYYVLCAIGMCIVCNCIVDNWNILCVSSNGRLRNSADFLFKASGIQVAELSVNMAEFWFFGRLLFLSHVKHILAEF
jgi:hypothetical protein